MSELYSWREREEQQTLRRFAFRLAVALFTFALGVFISVMRKERESFWNLFYRSSTQTTGDLARKCIEKWENASPSSQTLGWDLTYVSVLTKMRLCSGSVLCEQWEKPAPPISKYISEWQGDPIISSIEIELPDGHASMGAMWFIRTKDQAYFWGFYPLDKDYSGGKHLIPTQDYDTVFDTLACWQPHEPRRQTFGAQGYIGFLSIYKERKFRQMLLPYEEFIKGGEYPADGNIQPGPFTKILEPLIAPLRTRPLKEDAADKQSR